MESGVLWCSQDLDLSLLLLVFSLFFTVVSRLLLYSTVDKTSRLKMKSFSTVRDPERFTELRGEEKREEGVTGDQDEMRWNQKRREQASQSSLPYVYSTVWTVQRCSRSYTEKRRGRKETEVIRRITGGGSKGERQIQPVISSLSVLHCLKYTEIQRVG